MNQDNEERWPLRNMIALLKERHPEAPWATEAQQQLERGVVCSIIFADKVLVPARNQ